MRFDAAFTGFASRLNRQQSASRDSFRRTVTERLFLNLLRLDAVDRQSGTASSIAQDVDWSYLLELAYREGMAPLIHDTLIQTPFQSISQVPISKFHYMYSVAQRRNNRAYLQLQEVLHGLQSEGIEAIVLKGAVLAKQVYQDTGLRPFKDIDILVRERDLNRAHAKLRSLGYQINRKGDPIPVPSDSDLRYRAARQYFHTEKDLLSIDLYWQLARYPYIVPIDYRGLWDRASTVNLGDFHARALSPEDTISHLSLDFTLDLWYGQAELRSLRDIAEITRCQEVDWDALICRTHKALMPSLYYTCKLAKDLLGAAIPEAALLRIYPGAGWWENWVVNHIRRNILNPRHPIKYVVLAVLMRLFGPEGYRGKATWLTQLLIPPRSLWNGIPRGLSRILMPHGTGRQSQGRRLN